MWEKVKHFIIWMDVLNYLIRFVILYFNKVYKKKLTQFFIYIEKNYFTQNRPKSSDLDKKFNFACLESLVLVLVLVLEVLVLVSENLILVLVLFLRYFIFFTFQLHIILRNWIFFFLIFFSSTFKAFFSSSFSSSD